MAAAKTLRCVAIRSCFGRCCALLALIGSLSAGATAAPGDGPAFEVGYDPFEEQYSDGDPFDARPAVYDPFEEPPQVLTVSNAQVESAFATPARRNESAALLRFVEPARSVSPQEPDRFAFQPAEQLPLQPAPPAGSDDPCAAAAEKPLGELTINIQAPAGELPRDFATDCWEQIETEAGPFAGARCWPLFTYHWNATCFCHRPLYFEEINLERYGYGCHDCLLQPAASAAHFFATVPALPYCMAAECPGECIYTLRHYRPGSCPPWRRHYPPRDGLAALTAGGVWTGLIFLIP